MEADAWSKTKPTKAGFYWIFHNDPWWCNTNRLSCILVEIDPVNGLCGWFPGMDYTAPINSQDWDGVMWKSCPTPEPPTTLDT